MRSIANKPSIFCQHATINSAFRWLPSLETSGDLVFTDVHADGIRLGGDGDDVAVLHYGYGSTN